MNSTTEVWIVESLNDRSFRFATAVGGLIQELPGNSITREYSRQLVRCSSSVGANYRGARLTKSDADSIFKLKIVEEELDESLYFLELDFF